MMSRNRTKRIALALVLVLALPILVPIRVADGQGVSVTSGLNARQVRETLERVADWQLSHPASRDPRHWSLAPLYEGLIDTTLTTGEPIYMAAVLKEGRHIGFELGSRTYHADGHAAGRAWLRLYMMDPAKPPEVLELFTDQFDEIVENPIADDLSFLTPPPAGRRRTDRWTWSDALYMSPPTIGLLAQITGDDRYLAFLDAEYMEAYDDLFDPQEHLFYRDETYIDDRTPNGKKVFWSRGNGWAYAGLALLLDSLRPDYPTRQFYVDVFQQMSQAILAAQQPDGHWYPSLLDPEQVPVGETSGSALFVLGLAWGVRNGLLDPAVHWPAAERGWKAIRTRIDADGAVNFVQPFGEAPVPFDPESRVTYGTGAVLMAGSEILRVLGAAADVEPTALFEQAEALLDEVPNISDECEDNDCDDQ